MTRKKEKDIIVHLTPSLRAYSRQPPSLGGERRPSLHARTIEIKDGAAASKVGLHAQRKGEHGNGLHRICVILNYTPCNVGIISSP